jgi:hypothetical protein
MTSYFPIPLFLVVLALALLPLTDSPGQEPSPYTYRIREDGTVSAYDRYGYAGDVGRAHQVRYPDGGRYWVFDGVPSDRRDGLRLFLQRRIAG